MLNSFLHHNKNFPSVGDKLKFLILLIFPLSQVLLAFIIDHPKYILSGLYSIIIFPDILITDYISIGGIGATFMNSAILTFINIFILWRLKIKVNGVSISAIFIVSGFAFFGKNIFNIWPIYLGCFLYSKYQGRKLKTVAIVAMFGTALAPLVNEIIYGFNIAYPINIFLGLAIGVLVGFIIPPLSSHFLRTHDGYSLYNIGFAAGFIGTVIMSIMKSYGFTVDANQILSTQYDGLLKIYLTLFFILLIVFGFFINNKSFKGYKEVLWYSGRLITDFTQLLGFGITLMNMGIMGLIGMCYVILSGGTLNGPIVGALLTIVGFSSFGKHPKNSVPILIGVFIAALTISLDIGSTMVIMSGLFATTLAPIAGEYGWLYGMFTGFLHLSVVMNVGYLQGGINLYNNGFSGGIVASILVPIIDAFKKGD